MTHLRIEQNGITEEVSNLIIDKLYNIVHNNTLDNTSNLLGRLHTAVTYREYITYLNTEYPELYISTDAYAIPFEDPNMITYLNSIGVGSNGYVTEAQAAAATVVANSLNTTVTKFNELKYFTSITTSKNGFSGLLQGNLVFMNWTALEEVDISNFTSLGHSNNASYGDAFSGCTALKKVTASDKLNNLGYRVFYNCSELEDIIGLPSEINVYKLAFHGCSKLKNSNFLNIAINIIGDECFLNCSLLSSILLDSTMTTIPFSAFRNCTSLTTVTGLNNITSIKNDVFRGCTSLPTLNLSGTITVGGYAFEGCTGLIGNAFPNVLFTTNSSANNSLIFAGCTLLTLITLAPLNLTIGGGAFFNCTALQTINNSSYITVVGNGAFARCNNLTSLNLSNLDFTNSTVLNAFKTSYNYNGNGGYLFSYCNNLTTIGINTFPNINYVGPDLFIDCRKLTGSLNFPDATEFGTTNYGRLFRNCELLTKLSFGHITLWGTATSLDATRGMATGCINLKILDLGDSVETVYLCNCYKDTALEAVLINVSTPPTITGGAAQLNSANILSYLFGNLSVIVYVPDAAVNTYKAADKWSVFANNIKGLSEYNEASILGS